jgi:hypothetical protein
VIDLETSSQYNKPNRKTPTTYNRFCIISYLLFASFQVLYILLTPMLCHLQRVVYVASVHVSNIDESATSHFSSLKPFFGHCVHQPHCTCTYVRHNLRHIYVIRIHTHQHSRTDTYTHAHTHTHTHTYTHTHTNSTMLKLYTHRLQATRQQLTAQQYVQFDLRNKQQQRIYTLNDTHTHTQSSVCAFLSRSERD